jgi:hypothetical protein
MRERDLEEKNALLRWLFDVGRGVVQATGAQLMAAIHRLGTVRKHLGEKTQKTESRQLRRASSSSITAIVESPLDRFGRVDSGPRQV